MAERALECLHDYAIHLRERRRIKRDPDRVFSSSAMSAVDSWEKEKFQEWLSAGRITQDGFLRISQSPLSRHTLESMGRAFPELKGLDLWAALITSDGTSTEEEMAKDPAQNIREVVRQIVEHELNRILPAKISSILDGIMETIHDESPVPVEELSKCRVGRKHQVHRVRHPKTGELVSEAERASYLQSNPEAA